MFAVVPLSASSGADAASSGTRANATTSTYLAAAQLEAARVYQRARIDRAVAKRRYWLRVMNRPLPQPLRSLGKLELHELTRAADWQWTRAMALSRRAHRPPHLFAWRCIQRYESGGNWHINTGNGYYGGLQFDIGFQMTYGNWLYRTKGTAEHWTPIEQMWAANRAHSSGRGFTPWPNTARACGLL